MEAEEKKSDNSTWYVGLSTGIVTAKGYSGTSINWGLDIGYRNNKYLSTEIQSTSNILKGDRRSKNWGVDTFSVFAAYRTNAKDRLKAKLKTKIGLTHMNNTGINNTEISYGIGISKEFDTWLHGAVMIDLDFTVLGKGVSYIEIKSIKLF